MSNIVFVTGGARSGKSNFAESLCIDQNNRTAYIATSIAFDDEMKDRVKKHQESRPSNWNTYEIYKDIHSIVNELDEKYDTVLLDCVTLRPEERRVGKECPRLCRPRLSPSH